MSQLSTRRLTQQDGRDLRRLNELFGQAFDDPQTYTGTPPDSDYVARLLAKDHVIVLVTEHEGEVVGGLVAYELEKFESERREIYIYDLAVSQTHRRQGIARNLINFLKEIARLKNVWVIYVQADYGDGPAVALYTSLGVREDVMHFDIAIETMD
ncbi:AAC(3)-I family aminoglycoside N-acetyltransferase [Aureimonas fodinaquatilis]|uniref:AAC(3)-I family aminoglycoside N-acetyltransferase n=1 Tax=Aureimonas fodinaquatilis TaxID=2565783 RepID=A0A5B0DYQ0_9HYPH|nr:AAC(3)-I family aminoglycoside N-acetyltransferase [Aureimonas fodinaquatilis]KAA0970891.1 AAC(3)-I family aminoglycoside N-acetyltransferase [Aureimonas fodinaquatilis]